MNLETTNFDTNIQAMSSYGHCSGHCKGHKFVHVLGRIRYITCISFTTVNTDQINKTAKQLQNEPTRKRLQVSSEKNRKSSKNFVFCDHVLCHKTMMFNGCTPF